MPSTRTDICLRFRFIKGTTKNNIEPQQACSPNKSKLAGPSIANKFLCLSDELENENVPNYDKTAKLIDSKNDKINIIGDSMVQGISSKFKSNIKGKAIVKSYPGCRIEKVNSVLEESKEKSKVDII